MCRVLDIFMGRSRKITAPSKNNGPNNEYLKFIVRRIPAKTPAKRPNDLVII
ncbi:hypothetical protein YN1HA_9530 [Sulfurisphaera ohwakuensis]